MAQTEFGTNHALAVKLWARKLFHESIAQTYFGRFLGKGTDSLIQWKDETKKSAGDRVRVGLRMNLSGTGVQGDDTLEGNEEALVTYSDDLLINQLRHAVRSKGKMSEQRVMFDVLEENKSALSDWYAARMDTAFFNQLAGYTAETDTRYTGNNAAIAPSANNIIWVDSDIATGDESIGATDTFTTAMLDRAKTRAETMDANGQPIIRPFKVDGEDKYVAFLHPYQVYNLRRESTANTVTWWEVNRSALSGGLSKGAKALYNGSLGEYNNTILHAANRVPLGVNSSTSASISTVRRAIFCGAQAALFGTGRDTGDPTGERMSFTSETFDYGNQNGVEAGMIFGMKKTVFNSRDFATIVMSSYATAP